MIREGVSPIQRAVILAARQFSVNSTIIFDQPFVRTTSSPPSFVNEVVTFGALSSVAHPNVRSEVGEFIDDYERRERKFGDRLRIGVVCGDFLRSEVSQKTIDCEVLSVLSTIKDAVITLRPHPQLRSQESFASHYRTLCNTHDSVTLDEHPLIQDFIGDVDLVCMYSVSTVALQCIISGTPLIELGCEITGSRNYPKGVIPETLVRIIGSAEALPGAIEDIVRDESKYKTDHSRFMAKYFH